MPSVTSRRPQPGGCSTRQSHMKHLLAKELQKSRGNVFVVQRKRRWRRHICTWVPAGLSQGGRRAAKAGLCSVSIFKQGPPGWEDESSDPGTKHKCAFRRLC